MGVGWPVRPGEVLGKERKKESGKKPRTVRGSSDLKIRGEGPRKRDKGVERTGQSEVGGAWCAGCAGQRSLLTIRAGHSESRKNQLAWKCRVVVKQKSGGVWDSPNIVAEARQNQRENVFGVRLKFSKSNSSQFRIRKKSVPFQCAERFRFPSSCQVSLN